MRHKSKQQMRSHKKRLEKKQMDSRQDVAIAIAKQILSSEPKAK